MNYLQKRNKKILFYLSRFPDFGGIERVTATLANYLSNQNISVDILSVRYNDKIDYTLNKQINIYHLPNSINLTSNNNIHYLQTLIDKNNYTTIIFQDSYETIEVLLYRINIRSAKLIIAEHNDPMAGFKLYTFKIKSRQLSLKEWIKLPLTLYHLTYKTRQRYRELYKYCNDYILLSTSFINGFKLISGLKTLEKLSTINNPLTIQRPISIPLKDKIVIFAGRLTSQKGIELLLDIWKLVQPKCPEWTLKIAGDGELRSIIENRINKEKISNIELLGYVSNMESLYKNASIFTMTSIFEGWGLVLTEAMSFGCVPIAFHSFASATDIIKNNINGFLIKPYNKKDYAHCLECLLKNENKLKILSNNAYQYSNFFNINNIGKQWLNMI